MANFGRRRSLDDFQEFEKRGLRHRQTTEIKGFFAKNSAS